MGRVLGLEAREAITVLRLGGRADETGREDGGRGHDGRLAWGMGELRVTAGRKMGDMGGDGLSPEVSIVMSSVESVIISSVISKSSPSKYMFLYLCSYFAYKLFYNQF